MMNHRLKQYCDQLPNNFVNIPKERQVMLEQLSKHIAGRLKKEQKIQLTYVCTHNSRRSHFGQIWAQVAAHYYRISSVSTFSGGTEATAFNEHAISALIRAGMQIDRIASGENPKYLAQFDPDKSACKCFSKVFSHPANPASEFAAIMTCSDAEENCPFIPGAVFRIATPYEDPKKYDHSEERDLQYDRCCRQIATEIFFVFSLVKQA